MRYAIALLIVSIFLIGCVTEEYHSEQDSDMDGASSEKGQSLAQDGVDEVMVCCETTSLEEGEECCWNYEKVAETKCDTEKESVRKIERMFCDNLEARQCCATCDGDTCTYGWMPECSDDQEAMFGGYCTNPLRYCPDEWVNNPNADPENPEAYNPDEPEYFMVGEMRMELNQFDIPWIEDNCGFGSEELY